MKLNKLYIAILLIAGILTSCKVGKSYVRPDLHLPDSLAQHQDTVTLEIRIGRKSTRIPHFAVL